MVETVKDDDGKVVSYIEWSLRDANGKEDSNGAYVFVRDLWIHNSLRFSTKIIRMYVDLIISKTPTSRFVYWERHKYGDRMRLFSKEQIERK
jgi:hypothetical protein